MGGTNSGKPKGTGNTRPRYSVYYDNRGNLEHVADFPSYKTIAEHLNVCVHTIWKLNTGKMGMGNKVSRYQIFPFGHDVSQKAETVTTILEEVEN